MFSRSIVKYAKSLPNLTDGKDLAREYVINDSPGSAILRQYFAG
jgi:hypothetical protein